MKNSAAHLFRPDRVARAFQPGLAPARLTGRQARATTVTPLAATSL